MKKLGITGVAGSGKSTLLTALHPKGGAVVVIEVPDERLDRLTEIHMSKRKVGVQIEVHDVHATAKTAAAAIAKLRDMDALLLAIPVFAGADPPAAVKTSMEDFILADMAPFETRLSRARKDVTARSEIEPLTKGLACLQEGKALRDVDWSEVDLGVFSPLAPITLRPIIAVINVLEGDSFDAPLPIPSFVAALTLEAEAASIGEGESLLKEFGIEMSVLNKTIRAAFDSLDLVTFLTTSDKESRAWAVRKGAKAPEAAGVVHSDMQRGFIRAETASYGDVIDAGSWDAAKAKGKVRLEGKEYIFKEGDVTHFRFAI